MWVAAEVGFVECEGQLLGAIKGGCQQFPGCQSRYCYHHAPHISTIEKVVKENNQNKGAVKFMIAQKQTHNNTYYQIQYKDNELRFLRMQQPKLYCNYYSTFILSNWIRIVTFLTRHVPAIGWCMPGLLKLVLPRKQVCLCICVCLF